MKFHASIYLMLFSASGLWLLSSCETEPVRTVPLNQTTIDFFKFQNGSEWIYQQVDDTMVQERVVVEDYTSGKNRFDKVEVSFMRYMLKSDLHQQVMVRAESGMGDPVDQIAYITMDSARTYGPIFWADAKGVSGGGNDSFRYDESVRIGGVEYNNVIRVAFANHPVYKNISISKELGIVQKQYRNGKVFRLRWFNLVR
ncbi:MAG: hypothetical protein RL160_1776 [Bacteroidota bacterium]|jgi:hypothetical protein